MPGKLGPQSYNHEEQTSASSLKEHGPFGLSLVETLSGRTS